MQFRPNKVDQIKHFFIKEINQREKISKNLEKISSLLEYVNKLLLITGASRDFHWLVIRQKNIVD